MKTFQWAIFTPLVMLVACTPPQSFVSSAPKASMLSEKGDLNMAVGLGSGSRIASHIFEFDAMWSPVNRFGIRSHLSSKGYSNVNDRLHSWDVGAVHYSSLGVKSAFEVSVGYGQGDITSGSRHYSSTKNDYPTLTLPSASRRYYSNASFQKWYLISAFSFRIPDEPDLQLAAGLRAQYVDYDRYLYIKHESWEYNRPFEVLMLEPFVHGRYTRGYLGVNTVLGYAMSIGAPQSPGIDHPVYDQLMFSFGFNFVFPKKSK